MEKFLMLFYVVVICTKEAVQYLFNVIVWRFSKKQYIGKKVYFKGHQHDVIGETYHHFYIEDTETSFLKDEYFRTGKYLLNKSQCKSKLSYSRF